MVIKRAVFSVYNKEGIVALAKELTHRGIEIIATSGTFKLLQRKKINRVQQVSNFIGFPEILTGRIKTIHPKLIAGILARRERPNHIAELKRYDIKLIDMVVCNFYPFGKILKREVEIEVVIEQIDIGGPNLVRAAAKNYKNVVVLTKPERYDEILEELKGTGDISIHTRHRLAEEAFREVAKYDMLIHTFFKRCREFT